MSDQLPTLLGGLAPEFPFIRRCRRSREKSGTTPAPQTGCQGVPSAGPRSMHSIGQVYRSNRCSLVGGVVRNALGSAGARRPWIAVTKRSIGSLRNSLSDTTLHDRPGSFRQHSLVACQWRVLQRDPRFALRCAFQRCKRRKEKAAQVVHYSGLAPGDGRIILAHKPLNAFIPKWRSAILIDRPADLDGSAFQDFMRRPTVRLSTRGDSELPWLM